MAWIHFSKEQVIAKVRGIKMFNRADLNEDSQIIMESSEMSWYKRWTEEVLENCVRCLFNNFDLGGISNLQIVATRGPYLKRILRRARSPQLLWLYWYNCGYSFLPPWIPMESFRS